MVKVTDADREAAAQFCIDLTGDITGKAPKILRGECDDWTEVQAFARHRIAGAKAALEKAVKEVEVRWGHIATPELRDAIRNIDPEECG